MWIDLKVTANTQKLVNELKKDLRKLDKDSDEAVNRTVEIGKNVAFDFAPKATGKTARAIKDFKRGDGRKTAILVAGDGHLNDKNSNGTQGKRWNGDRFNLTYWMHFSDKALAHPWRSGTPRFMDEAQEYMIREFGKKINMAVNAFVTGD